MGRMPGKGARLDLGELNPKQKLFCQARTRYVAYGGARGGGKSHVLRIKAVGGACTYPGIRILIVRREYPELEQTLILPIRAMVPPELATYNGTMRCLFFANGSMIKFGHYGAGDDVEYQGQEYDWIEWQQKGGENVLTDKQAEVLSSFEPPRAFQDWDGPDGDVVRWFLHEAEFIRSDVRLGEDCFVLTESGKKALNEYRTDRADRADKKREKKQDRIHDFVVAAFGAFIGIVGTLLTQVFLGVI